MADSRALERLARLLEKHDRKIFQLETAPQLSYSSLPIDGEEMPVPVAIGRGVAAGAIAEQVREDLDEAREQLDAAMADLESRTDEAEQALADAEERLDGAEGRIDAAFTLAEQAKSNMPNRVDDPDFSFGDQDWQGEGGQFTEYGGGPVFLFGARLDGAVTPIAETVDRFGTTAGGPTSWGTAGSTYELRFEGNLVGAAPFTVTFGGLNASQQVTKTITSAAELAEPIRLTWPAGANGLIRVRIQATTTGAASAFAILTSVSVTDVTTITEVKATADAALLSANGKQNIYRDTGDPSGTAPENSVWFKVDGAGSVIGQYQYVDNAWVETPVASEVIANLDVGKLTAGSGVISDLVAQEIASASGQFLELDVGQLVASQAVLDEAVAQKIWSDAVVTNLLTAEEIIAGDAIVDGTITAEKLQAEQVAAELGQFLQVDVGQLNVGHLGENQAPPLTSAGWEVEPISEPFTLSWTTVGGEDVMQASATTESSNLMARATDTIPLSSVAGRTMHVDMRVRAVNPLTTNPEHVSFIPLVMYYDAAGDLVSLRLGVQGVFYAPIQSTAWIDYRDTIRVDDVDGAESVRLGIAFGMVHVATAQVSRLEARQSETPTLITDDSISTVSLGADNLSVSGEVSFDAGLPGSELADRSVTPSQMHLQRTSSWDDATETGFYYAPSGATGAPVSGVLYGEVYREGLDHSSALMWQRVHSGRSTYYRTKNQFGAWLQWTEISSPRIAVGEVSFPVIDSGTYEDFSVSFTFGTFSAAPTITLSPESNGTRLYWSIRTRSSTGFTFRLYNDTSGGQSAGTLMWQAIQA